MPFENRPSALIACYLEQLAEECPIHEYGIAAPAGVAWDGEESRRITIEGDQAPDDARGEQRLIANADHRSLSLGWEGAHSTHQGAALPLLEVWIVNDLSLQAG